MLRINCPYCGTRDQDEFQFGGEVNIVRPENPEQASDAEWASYLFYRDNLKGQHRERWLHSFGCRQWFVVTRDTLTHEISRVFTLEELAAAGAGGVADA